MTRKIISPAEMDGVERRRQEDIAYREGIIEKQDKQITKQQELFGSALDAIRKDLLPLLEKTLAELQARK